MKKMLLCLAALVLSSCIPVDDLGAYWGKGTVDKALLGTWEKIGHEGDKSQRVRITEKDGAYFIDSLDEEEKKKPDYAPLAARTLKAGDYRFLMLPNHLAGSEGPLSGDIVRYELHDNVLQTFNPNDRRMSAWIREKYPAAKNIGDPGCGATCTGSMRILTLDGESWDILSSLPATGEFWVPSESWRKLR
jgi:hypothetical protein